MEGNQLNKLIKKLKKILICLCYLIVWMKSKSIVPNDHGREADRPSKSIRKSTSGMEMRRRKCPEWEEERRRKCYWEGSEKILWRWWAMSKKKPQNGNERFSVLFGWLVIPWFYNECKLLGYWGTCFPGPEEVPW